MGYGIITHSVEPKQQLLQWRHTNPPKSKQRFHQKNYEFSLLVHNSGILVNFTLEGRAITADTFCETMRHFRGALSKQTEENAVVYSTIMAWLDTARVTSTLLWEWDILDNPPYSSEHAPQ